jgi:DNA-binding transcriptional ArsR family regulator
MMQDTRADLFRFMEQPGDSSPARAAINFCRQLIFACTMDTIEHPPLDTITLEEVLHALGDPARMQIVRTAAKAEEGMPCCAFNLDLPKATASRHFQILRNAGIIQQRPEGTQHLTSLRRRELDARFPGLLAAVLRTTK